ncbi:helix-turn-helix domain-containing protein [Meiothermus taiwanensis]|uniref:helix-turn-helix domain-containing protein n=1 Tax=Meiothermus taiwanensis TaxID=172827 RepID=UPI0009E3CF02
MNSEFITTGKAAKILGVANSTVTEMCKRGEFPGAYRPGKWWRIPLAEVEKKRRPVSNKSQEAPRE